MTMTKIQEEIIEEIQANIKDFFVEHPEIIVAMAKGYKLQMYFDLPPKHRKSLKLEANIIAEEGKEMTLIEFLEIHQKQIKDEVN